MMLMMKMTTTTTTTMTVTEAEMGSMAATLVLQNIRFIDRRDQRLRLEEWA